IKPRPRAEHNQNTAVGHLVGNGFSAACKFGVAFGFGKNRSWRRLPYRLRICRDVRGGGCQNRQDQQIYCLFHLFISTVISFSAKFPNLSSTKIYSEYVPFSNPAGSIKPSFDSIPSSSEYTVFVAM